jgi:hypothetical protein
VSCVEGCLTKDDLYPPRKNWLSKVFRAKEASESCIALILISSFVGHGDLNREVTINDMVFNQTIIFFSFGIKRYGSGERTSNKHHQVQGGLNNKYGEPAWDWAGPWCGGNGREESRTADQANNFRGP